MDTARWQGAQEASDERSFVESMSEGIALEAGLANVGAPRYAGTGSATLAVMPRGGEGQELDVTIRAYARAGVFSLYVSIPAGRDGERPRTLTATPPLPMDEGGRGEALAWLRRGFGWMPMYMVRPVFDATGSDAPVAECA